MILFLSLLFGGLIGLSLGSLGAGGAILVLPALIYGLEVDPKEAVVAGLIIVGFTSLYSSVLHWRWGHVRISTACLFAITGAVGAYQGAWISQLVSEVVLLVCLAVVMAAAGTMMLRSSNREETQSSDTARSSLPSVLLVLVCGYVVGLLTGFLGIGGGFLIVPALIFFARIPIKQAVGTSLVVISINCASGYFAHSPESVDWNLILPFLVGSFVVSLFASRFARRVKPRTLKKMFAYLILVISSLILISNLYGEI